MPEPGTESLLHAGWDSQEPIFASHAIGSLCTGQEEAVGALG